MTIPLVAVIGSGSADSVLQSHAHEVGATVARAGFGLVCGGLGGVMEAACRGAAAVFGTGTGRIVGVLPGPDPAAANRWVDIAIATDTGKARNVVIVLSAVAVVVVGGESGTLSELAHAWQLGRPIAAYTAAGGWGAKLAGQRLDHRRSDRIVAIESAAALATWLAARSASTSVSP